MLSEVAGNNKFEIVKSYTVFDLETTGTSIFKDDVIEISAVKVRDGKVVDEFSSLVNPGRPIPFWASQVNGITDDMVCDCPVFEEVLKDFIDFIGDDVLVGHNIHTFDMKFIYRFADEFWGKTIDNDYIDTLKLSRTCLPHLKHHKLVDLANYFQISSEGAHRALHDCRMNQEVYECLSDIMLDSANSLAINVCPKCGDLLKLRNGRFGEFYGCSNYPNCKFTMNV